MRIGARRAAIPIRPIIVINVCSQMGTMAPNAYKKELIDKFAGGNFTEADVDKFVEDFKKLAHENRSKEGGYPDSAYHVSKAAEIALSMVQAKQMAAKGVSVNPCCPGYVATDMTNHKGKLTVEEGAETPIWLATMPTAPMPSGAFVKYKKAIEWLQKA